MKEKRGVFGFEQKKAFFFTMDVVLAVITLTVGFVLVWSSFTAEPVIEQPYFLAENVAAVMTGTTNAEVMDRFPPSSAVTLAITRIENTVFEQIAEFYADGQIGHAEVYAGVVLQDILPEQYSLRIIIHGGDIARIIYTDEGPTGEDVSDFLISAKRIIIVVSPDQSDLLGPYIGEVQVW